MLNSLSRIFTLTKRNIKEILRDPLSLAFILALPLVMEILFYLIFHELSDQFQMIYLAPGIVVFAQSFLSLFVGLLLATDRNTSFLTRLYVSKAHSHEFIIAYALAVIPISIVQAILFYLVGGIFDRSIFSTGMVLSILVSVITAIFFISLGLLFGSIFSAKSIGGVASIAISGQSVLSGMWFPIDGINQGMKTFMEVLPFKNATLLVQNLVTDGIHDGFADFGKPLIIVLAYTVVTFIGAIYAFRTKMKFR